MKTHFLQNCNVVLQMVVKSSYAQAHLFFALILITISTLFPSCGKAQEMIGVESHWQDHPERFRDLEKHETPSIEKYRYLPEMELYYSIANDEENLFVNLEFGNRMEQQKVAMFGATLWINLEGKRKKDKGIEYPLAEEGGRPIMIRRGEGIISMEEGPPSGGSQPFQGRAIDNRGLLNNKTRLVLNNFAGEDRIEKDHLESGSVRAAVWSNNMSENLIYSAVIPFEMLGLPGLDSPIAIGIETGTIQRRPGEEGRSMMGGGERSQERQGMNRMGGALTPTEIWFKVNLATAN